MSADADVVIVGAGSAGCVLAARLVEAGAGRVALIEAGPDSRDPRLAVPLMTGVLLRNKSFNWCFRSEPVPELNGRRIDWPRGKVVGGSGAINGMVYARGLAADFDGWGQSGLLDWTWERVRPYFERAEGKRGGGLALGLTQPDWWHPLYDAYLGAAESAGLGRAKDLNAPEAEGAGRYTFMIENGRRASTARLFLDPVRRDPNLRLYDRALVRGLVFDGRRCTGVRIERGGRIETITAGREVVLSAGTVGSPHILMLSGIGDAGHLSEVGIDVVADRPAVGRNLHDHLLVRVEHSSLKPGPLGPLLRADRAMLAVANAYLRGRGPAGVFPLLVGGYFRSEPGLDRPDLQSHFLPALSSATLRINPFRRLTGEPMQDGFFANVSQMRPESRGAIRLASADPHAPPLIAPRHLSTERDVLVMRGSVRVLRRLFAQEEFASWRGRELAPGADVASDDEVDAWVRETASTMFHPVGACNRTDGESVTDEALKVRGVEGLRVVDASVMPSITSANTQAPTIMIAEKAAELIGRRHRPSVGAAAPAER